MVWLFSHLGLHGSNKNEKPKRKRVVFDSLLHQPVRSKLLSLLITNDELPFKALKELLGVTDGNLSSHLSKLE
ncbi:MAG: transcriptional regulator, partial [Sulfurovaceae bacterium]|nr:transcriptional regulator [Sulfurovaceae bacterium]